MNSFAFVAITNEGQALDSPQNGDHAKFLAGGTTLLDLMKLGVEQPATLIDIHRLPAKIEELPDHSLRIGATVTNSDLAYHKRIRERYPLLSQAILSGASPQLRNMATTAGNLLQRTRCPYFRDPTYPCNKRRPGSGLAAIHGFNRSHAILGTSEKCIATHPSDMCVALAALEAIVIVRTPDHSERRIPFDQFYISYGVDPAQETTLQPGELITAVEIPPLAYARRSSYLKIRDRASYEFALASAAVALDLQNGTIREARIALGGIATKPWRSREAEAALAGKPPTAESYTAAANAALAGAIPQSHNRFKIELAQRTLIRALTNTAAIG